MAETGSRLEIKIDTKQADKRLAAIGRELDTRVMLKLIGESFKLFVTQAFRTGGASTGRPWAPLRPNTLANPNRGGGSSMPLARTGALMQSFVTTQDDVSVTVGTKKQYASFHQFGTAPYTIRPVNKKALFFWTVGGNAAPFEGRGNTFARVVHHPGLPVRQMLPNEAQARRLAQETLRGYVDRILEKTRGKN